MDTQERDAAQAMVGLVASLVTKRSLDDARKLTGALESGDMFRGSIRGAMVGIRRYAEARKLPPAQGADEVIAGLETLRVDDTAAFGDIAYEQAIIVTRSIGASIGTGHYQFPEELRSDSRAAAMASFVTLWAVVQLLAVVYGLSVPEAAQRLSLDIASQEADEQVKVGRNDPCPCGSGKKYKHCCGA